MSVLLKVVMTAMLRRQHFRTATQWVHCVKGLACRTVLSGDGGVFLEVGLGCLQACMLSKRINGRRQSHIPLVVQAKVEQFLPVLHSCDGTLPCAHLCPRERLESNGPSWSKSWTTASPLSQNQTDSLYTLAIILIIYFSKR